jgi:hypothetical protein
MIGTRRALLAIPGIRYLLRATFSTDMAAPLPASLPVDVGGPLTVVQNDGQFSQSGGKLVFPAQTTAAWGDLHAVDASGRARVAGRALLFAFSLTATQNAWIGWNNDNSPTTATTSTEIQAVYLGASMVAYPANIGVASIVATTDYEVAIILRSTGSLILIRGGIFATWTLLWVNNSGNAATLYPAFSNFNSAGTLDNFRVLDLNVLDSRFATDEGLAVARIASNSTGDAITQTADGWVEQTLTAATGVDKDLYVRWTDDNNCWIVRQNQAGSTVKLIEKVAGVETSRGSVATTYTNAVAYRHIAICEGSVIKVYVDTTLKITYSSASFQATATTAKAPSVGTEFKSYPRTPSLPSGV